ncbi:MAG: protein translocase subunit SecF [Gammaproteobacteria bacterium]|nr:protein translocase subunit SecF [Gammaproteobacteria bacterium]
MELFNPNSKYDFMGWRQFNAIFSVILVLISLVGLGVRGLNWGLDFTGGTQVEMSFDSVANIDQIRTTLNKLNIKEPQVMAYGNSHDVLISLSSLEKSRLNKVRYQLEQAFKDGHITQINYIGPQIGHELATKGLIAVIVSVLATMVYIAIRFEYRLAVSSAIALIHDPMLILGVFAWFGIEFDLKALAALLAVIGYSLNDTIVVFDRVRENFLKVRRTEAIEIMNLSINQTLSRTIMTSFLTLSVVLALLFLGGESLQGFSLALSIGIIIGTYSSIYVAGSLAIWMGLSKIDFIPKPKMTLGEEP